MKTITRKTYFQSLLSLFFAVMVIGTGLQSWAQEDTDPLIVSGYIQPTQLEATQTAELLLLLELPDEFHAYEDKFRLEILSPSDFKMGGFNISPLVEFFDPVTKKQKRGVEKKAELRAAIEVPQSISSGAHELEIRLWYQACTAKFCLFPKEKLLKVPFQIGSQTPEQKPTDSVIAAVQSGNFNRILQMSFALGLLLTFLAGVLTSFSPCIFPMIPITIAVLGHGSENRTRRQNFLLSLIYVLGIAFTYSLLGIAAAKTGALFGSLLGNPWVLGVTAALFLTMALSMFGLFELQMPNWVRQTLSKKTTGTGYKGAFIAGLLAGILASPCVGPILVGILTFVAQTQNPTLGFLYLFAYAFGMGQLFLLLGLTNQVSRFLPKSGAWMDAVKIFFGFLLLIAAFYYLQLLLPPRIFQGAVGLALVLIGSYFGAFKPNDELGKIGKLVKGIMTMFLILGALQVALAVLDQKNPLTPSGPVEKESLVFEKWDKIRFEKALLEKKPIMIDFWADWCEACKELEHKTFPDPKIVELGKKFTLLKFDATKSSPELAELRKQYQIKGLPTLLFFSAEGAWLPEITVTGFENADEFSKRMESALNHVPQEK